MFKVTDNNITIKNSYQYRRDEMDNILDIIESTYMTNVTSMRSRYSLKMEWAVHNALHGIGLWEERTKDVDLNYPCEIPEWIYCMIGFVVWPFIK